SASRAAVLGGAFARLMTLRWGTTELLASRIITLSAWRGRLGTLGGPEPDVARPETAVTAAREALLARQRRDGGFPLWDVDDASHPWASLHAGHALARAKDAGYAVPKAALERALVYAQRVPVPAAEAMAPPVGRALAAYALYVRERL